MNHLFIALTRKSRNGYHRHSNIVIVNESTVEIQNGTLEKSTPVDVVDIVMVTHRYIYSSEVCQRTSASLMAWTMYGTSSGGVITFNIWPGQRSIKKHNCSEPKHVQVDVI